MADDPVFLITGASTGIGAADRAPRPRAAGYRVVLAARSQDKLDALAAELGGDGARARGRDATSTEWEDNERARRRPRSTRFGRIDVVFANAGFGAKRGFLEETPEHWRDMVLTNVLGCALHDPRDAARRPRVRGPLPADEQRRGPRRAARAASTRAPSGRSPAMGEVAARGARRQRRARHADRAGHGRHAVLRQPARRARSPTRTSPTR